MLLLALDTSAAASAAVVRDGRVLAHFASSDTRSHAEVLAPAIRGLLAHTHVAGPEFDAIVVGVGPGPFTGLRAGLATARMLAFVWDVPLHGMMSLDALAAEASAAPVHPGRPGEFVVATDARRREVYWARYSRPARPGGPPQLLEGPHVGSAQSVPGLPVYGRGAGLYPGDLDAVPAFADSNPDARSLGLAAAEKLLSGQELLGSTPLYLRESDARVPGPRKRASA